MYIILTKNKELFDLAQKNGDKVIVSSQSQLSSIETILTKHSQSDIEFEIVELLTALGIPSHLNGFEYLKYTFEQVLVNPSFWKKGLTTNLYPKLADHFGVTTRQIARAVQYALDVSFVRGSIDLYAEIFGNSISLNKCRPTNAHFIKGLIAYLRKSLSD